MRVLMYCKVKRYLLHRGKCNNSVCLWCCCYLQGHIILEHSNRLPPGDGFTEESLITIKALKTNYRAWLFGWCLHWKTTWFTKLFISRCESITPFYSPVAVKISKAQVLYHVTKSGEPLKACSVTCWLFATGSHPFSLAGICTADDS